MPSILKNRREHFPNTLLIPGYSSTDCIPSHVDLKTPLIRLLAAVNLALCKYPCEFGNHAGSQRRRLAVALAKRGESLSFIPHSRSKTRQRWSRG
jgi:IMP dehydrogenase